MATSLHLIRDCRPFVFAKAEYETPTGSGKFRIASALVADALETHPGATGIVDATSGGTGKSIARVAGALGKATKMFMPESSRDRAILVESEGGSVELVAGGMDEAADCARRFAETHPEFAYTGQFDSMLNVETHRQETAHELVAELGGNFDRVWVVAGSGTGGTLAGVTRGLADFGIDVRPICPVPVNRDGGFSARVPGVAHRASRFLDWDDMETLLIDEEAALERCRTLIRDAGLECGPSSGMNVLAAEQVARCRARPNDCVVTFLPDRRDAYDFLTDAALGIGEVHRFAG